MYRNRMTKLKQNNGNMADWSNNMNHFRFVWIALN